MKTTVLLAAVLFISTAAFSQEVDSKNTASTRITANAGTETKTNTLAKTTGKADKASHKAVNAVASEKQAAKDDAKSDANLAKSTAKQNGKVSAGSQTDMTAHSTIAGNNSGKDASLRGKASVSSNGIYEESGNLKNNGKATMHAGAGTLQQTSKSLKTDAKAANGKIITNVNDVHQSVKPHPAFVKMNAHVGASSRVKIK